MPMQKKQNRFVFTLWLVDSVQAARAMCVTHQHHHHHNVYSLNTIKSTILYCVYTLCRLLDFAWLSSCSALACHPPRRMRCSQPVGVSKKIEIIAENRKMWVAYSSENISVDCELSLEAVEVHSLRYAFTP